MKFEDFKYSWDKISYDGKKVKAVWLSDKIYINVDKYDKRSEFEVNLYYNRGLITHVPLKTIKDVTKNYWGDNNE